MGDTTVKIFATFQVNSPDFCVRGNAEYRRGLSQLIEKFYSTAPAIIETETRASPSDNLGSAEADFSRVPMKRT